MRVVADLFLIVIAILLIVLGYSLEVKADEGQDVTIIKCVVIDDTYESCDTLEGIKLICDTKSPELHCDVAEGYHM